MPAPIPDVAIIGAGVFGSWTARQLQRAGQRVLLLDAHGAASSRASSGGESRVIRMGYGADAISSRWALQSLPEWQALSARAATPLFHPTGVLWMARDADPYAIETCRVLAELGVPFEQLARADLAARYPQIDFGPIGWGILEPDSGVLMARRAVQLLARETVAAGAEFLAEAVTVPVFGKAGGEDTSIGLSKHAASSSPSASRDLDHLITQSGRRIQAGAFVFACGPWLPKLFPEFLGGRIHPTRQEVFFFGPPAGDLRFAPPAMPAWVDFVDGMYGIPNLEGRGFKVGIDAHGPAFDPDSDERSHSAEGLERGRSFLGQRFPTLADAPLLESRVCQYENTSNGDFLIDRHPAFNNVWLVGGGSGHGFKHGPALGAYVAERITQGGALDARFTLASKRAVRARSVY
jgi:glycine/D-amino acid oxidase-like deaminating enzyme